MSDNNGGPASEKTLRDEFAGQALAGMCANPGGPIQGNGTTGWGFANCNREYVAGLSYDLAAAMLAEKARREATGKDCSQVPDHSPDAGKMARLEEENRELAQALRKFVEAGSGWSTHEPTQADAFKLAHAVLAKHQTHKKEAGHE